MRTFVLSICNTHLVFRVCLFVVCSSLIYVLLCGIGVHLCYRRVFGPWEEDLFCEFVGPAEWFALNGPRFLAAPVGWYFSWCSTSAGGPPCVYP
jgi:hypothetical protein